MQLPKKVVSGSLLLKAAVILIVAVGMREARAAAAEDVLIRRDGSRSTGQLKACAGERCNWGGATVPRSDIAWIGFGDAGAPPVPGDPVRDQVWLRDGRTVVGEIVGVSLGSVATESDSFDRPDVRWIYFGSAEGIPRQSESPAGVAGPLSATGNAPAPASPATNSGTEPAAPAPAPPAPVAPAPPKLYLNEVSVHPDGGRSAFVELRNAGPEPIPLAGVVLRNERGTVCSLPKNDSVPGAHLYLVSLDRQPGGGTRCPPDFLSPRGSVELQSAGGRWDFLDWGDTPAGLALRTRGGRIAEVGPGSSFGRSSMPSAVGRPTWVRYSGAQVTPGAPNPVPAVDNFMALPGAIFDRRAVPLTWYTVAGATSYRVQVATATDFASPLFDRSLETPDGVVNRMAQATTEPLADGRYFWRVQALTGLAEAPFSAPRSFEVRAAGGGSRARRSSVA